MSTMNTIKRMSPRDIIFLSPTAERGAKAPAAAVCDRTSRSGKSVFYVVILPSAAGWRYGVLTCQQVLAA
jgi:hypothetical protein